MSGGWDSTIRCWDPRAPSGSSQRAVTTQPERIYSMSVVNHKLVAAMAGRHVAVFDLRQMSEPEQRRESSLKFQTRCVRIYPNGTGRAHRYLETSLLSCGFSFSCAYHEGYSTSPVSWIRGSFFKTSESPLPLS